jgi:hypothetical protein
MIQCPVSAAWAGRLACRASAAGPIPVWIAGARGHARHIQKDHAIVGGSDKQFA